MKVNILGTEYTIEFRKESADPKLKDRNITRQKRWVVQLNLKDRRSVAPPKGSGRCNRIEFMKKETYKNIMEYLESNPKKRTLLVASDKVLTKLAYLAYPALLAVLAVQKIPICFELS